METEDSESEDAAQQSSSSSETSDGEAPPPAEEVDDEELPAELVELSVEANDTPAVFRLAFQRSSPDAVLRALDALVTRKVYEAEELVATHFGVFVAAVQEVRPVQEDAEDLCLAVRAHNEALQAGGTPLLEAVAARERGRANARRLAAVAAALDACLAATSLCQRCGDAVGRGEYYASLRVLERVRASLPSLPSRVLRVHLSAQLPAAEAGIEERAMELLDTWLAEAEAAAPAVGRAAVAAAADAQADADSRWARQATAVRAASGEGVGDTSGFSLRPAARDSSAPPPPPLCGLSLAPLATARHALACLGREALFWGRYSAGRSASLGKCLSSPDAAAFLERHQRYLCGVAGFFAIEAGVVRSSRGALPPAWLASSWDRAGVSLASVLERNLDVIPTVGEALLVAHFARLVAAALRSEGLWTAALEAALAEAAERFHALSVRQAIASLPPLSAAATRCVIHSPRAFESDVVALGLGPPDDDAPPPASAFPLTAPFSSTVASLLKAARQAAADSVAFCGVVGAGRHLTAVFAAADAEALSPALAAAAGQPAHLLQLLSNAVCLEAAAPATDAHLAALCRTDVSVASRAGGGAPAGVLSSHRERSEAAFVSALCAAFDTALRSCPAEELTPEVPRSSASRGVVAAAFALGQHLAAAVDLLPHAPAARVARAALSHASDALMAPLLSDDGGRRFNSSALIGLARDCHAVVDAVRPLGDVADALSALAEPLQLCALFAAGGAVLERLAASPADPPAAFRAALQAECFAIAPQRLATLLERYREPPAAGLLHRAGPAALFSQPFAKRKTVAAVGERVRSILKGRGA